MLDVALLTANASQLKYVLTAGDRHPFYDLMLSLIIISIILQVRFSLLIKCVCMLVNVITRICLVALQLHTALAGDRRGSLLDPEHASRL